MDKNRPRWQAGADPGVLLQRARLLKTIRAYFAAQDVLEVETPLLSHAATTDPHLNSLQSRFRNEACYLNTSPEHAMKRLLAGWSRPIYQVCKAFRDDAPGPLHNPEFTLLEWYRPGYDMHQLMREMQVLLTQCWQQCAPMSPRLPGFVNLSYRQAFEQALGFNPHTTGSQQCYQLALERGIEVPQGLDAQSPPDEWLDWFMLIAVAPQFDKKAFTFLYDYPATQCSLAKIGSNRQGDTVAKRFELFYGEIELANGFEELTDAAEQLQRFRRENMERELAGLPTVPLDQHFLAALASGLPECSGVALGLDRVLMVLTGVADIRQVLAFSWEGS